MGETVTHRSIISAARREIRALKRPPAMRADVWRGVRDLLDALAGYLPEVWPSQRTLARKLEVSQSAIQRRVNAATKAGLITTTVHSHAGWRDGRDYHLMCLSTGLKATISRVGSRVGSDSEVPPSPSEKERSFLPSSKGGTPGGACGAAEQDNVIPMSDYRDDPDPIGSDPTQPLPQRSVRPVDQGARLAAIFDECWAQMARKHKEWRSVRPSDRGMAVRYIKGVMLDQVDLDIAEAYIRSYAPAVADGRCEPKLGQYPFMHFTTWWGREEIEDPKIKADRKAEDAAITAAYEQMRRDGLV